MTVSPQNIELSGIEETDLEEKMRWERVEREAVTLCDPLSRILHRKDIIFRTGVSEGQLSRELSPDYDNRLSLVTALYILRHSQHERLAQLLICDGGGYRLPEPQKRKVSTEERLRALEAECRNAGPAGAALLDAADKRARSGR